ncbi:BON1-associated protein 2 [Cajanus cajan]|uniref:C2 domain-containing protein n=1 Tax=Cajanus cajan TaxID=3821 RepID=A0A151TBD9_CAJCA|nr:BON1-associated protein 2 [Cajanus cajan]KYP64370.1 hypothetical protein KK1_018966 [Cajanus cajan]
MKGKPIRKDAYVVVHTQSCTRFFTTQEEGGSNPLWNERFMVDGAKCVTLEVQCKTWLGVRSVGAARIPVDDFLGGFVAGNNRVQFLSYRLWDGKGRRNGVINFSVRVVKASTECDEERTMVDIQKNFPSSGGVVTGIPVFWSV